MPNIITRYLIREILKSSSATVLILFLILMGNALGQILSSIADGEVPRQALLPVLLSNMVNLFSLLLPIGFFLGIVFAFGRLYKDNEIVVMNACGMGQRQFYRPVIIILIPLVIFSAYANIWLGAKMHRYAQKTVESEKNVDKFDQVRAGQFNQSKSSDQVFYMESISDDRLELRNVLISQSRDNVVVMETAETGRHRTDEKSGDLFLVVGPGERYEGIPGKRDYTIVEFEKHGILIEKKKNKTQDIGIEARSPSQLWQSKRVKYRTELHWRIAVTIVMVVLAFLAVPLSYIAPRQGRFGKVGYAILAYLVYFNLMAVTRSQLETKAIPLALNFWWVHAIFITLTIALLFKRGSFSRLRKN